MPSTTGQQAGAEDPDSITRMRSSRWLAKYVRTPKQALCVTEHALHDQIRPTEALTAVHNRETQPPKAVPQIA